MLTQLPAPQRAGRYEDSRSKRRQEVVPRRRRDHLKIEQRQKIDRAEITVPCRRSADARAYGQIGAQKLGNLRKCRQRRVRRLYACALLLGGASVGSSWLCRKLRRNQIVLKLVIHLPAFARILRG